MRSRPTGSRAPAPHRFQTRVAPRKHHPRASLRCRFRFGRGRRTDAKNLFSFFSAAAPAPPPPAAPIPPLTRSPSAVFTVPLLLGSHPSASAAHPRAYVKGHEFWRRRSDLAESGGSAEPSAFGPKVDGSNPSRAADNAYASEIERALGKRRRGGDDERDGTDPSSRDDAAGVLGSRRGEKSRTEPEDADLRANVPDDDAKDELAKEWAALTTWIRMNLHQPRTNKRKVLFVGHHPRLHPVPGAEAAIGETGDEAERWRGRLGPSGEVIGSLAGGAGGGGKRAKVSGDAHDGGGPRKGRIDGEDFVRTQPGRLVRREHRHPFTANARGGRWTSSNESTSARTRVGEEGAKVQAAGLAGWTNVQRAFGKRRPGIQETFYDTSRRAGRAALERDGPAARWGGGGRQPERRSETKVPTTPSPPRTP